MTWNIIWSIRKSPQPDITFKRYRYNWYDILRQGRPLEPGFSGIYRGSADFKNITVPHRLHCNPVTPTGDAANIFEEDIYWMMKDQSNIPRRVLSNPAPAPRPFLVPFALSRFRHPFVSGQSVSASGLFGGVYSHSHSPSPSPGFNPSLDPSHSPIPSPSPREFFNVFKRKKKIQSNPSPSQPPK